MARVRDLLDRFRPAGTPGAAARAGVPVDRQAELAAELEVVFAALAETQAESARIVEQANRDAGRTRDRSRTVAAGVVADAHRRAEAERADAAARSWAAAEADAAETVAEAERRAETVRRRVGERLPAVAERAVDLVRDLADGGPADPPGHGPGPGSAGPGAGGPDAGRPDPAGTAGGPR